MEKKKKLYVALGMERLGTRVARVLYGRGREVVGGEK